MNTKEYMIIIKNNIRTKDVQFCEYNKTQNKWSVTFNNGLTYEYLDSNVILLKNPEVVNPDNIRIKKNGKAFFDIKNIYVFKNGKETYWHICFTNNYEGDYNQRDLDIVKSCLENKDSTEKFKYLKELSYACKFKNDNGEINSKKDDELLAKRYENISFIPDDVALAKYLDPSLFKSENIKDDYAPIFPFGCNNSQYDAVKKAMSEQFSVIQGPPGTGKTQTILNIIANILMQNKTVLVVSNNNTATENVYEKLMKYNLDFIIASLGCYNNKSKFIDNQKSEYPDFSSWKIKDDRKVLKNSIINKSMQLKDIFNKKEQLAKLKQENSQLNTEYKYFMQYSKDQNIDTENIINKLNISSKYCMELWQECQNNSDMNKPLGFFFKIKAFFKYGIKERGFFNQDILKVITILQSMYYHSKSLELSSEIQNIETYLKDFSDETIKEFCKQSMDVLRDELARKYETSDTRKIFSLDDLWRKSSEVLEEYPVILSTTFSSRNSLNSNIVYDYLIIDEASQVDIVTGALSLSCAKNVVIVGDTKQLPNVVEQNIKEKSEIIFNKYNFNSGYRFSNSLLQSILDVMPNVPQTLLREHYRCHPKIINYCNQKFYNGQLVIMTTDKGEKDVLSVVHSNKGNHSRDHYSQRQVDIIKDEIIPEYDLNMDDTGIIAPYNNQVNALNANIKGIDSATVHKFQGREKDNIIISTVDDIISDFADDPNLINVAVSRAKKRLMLVVTGNEQQKSGNITDLVDYIKYNNFEVVNSKIYSVFDYLYKQYTIERRLYLQKHKLVSEFDSENLMYSLICDIINEKSYFTLDVVCHIKLCELIKNYTLLNDEEYKFVMNSGTHLDFLIYNRLTKKPVLAIEVDGHQYHKKFSVQASRDLMKNHILESYKIPLLRFKTNGSGEKEKIIEMLDKIVV